MFHFSFFLCAVIRLIPISHSWGVADKSYGEARCDNPTFFVPSPLAHVILKQKVRKKLNCEIRGKR